MINLPQKNYNMDKETNLLKAKIKELEKENSLLQTHQNYETFFNTINDFLFVLDEQCNIIHTNSTVIDRLGYTREELVGNSVLMVHPANRREEAGRIVDEMLMGTAEFCPVPLITKSGKQIPVETRVQQGNWNGKPAIFGFTKDVSKIKLSEEKLRLINKRYSVLFNQSPIAIEFYDALGGLIIVNEACLELFGVVDKNEISGFKLFENPNITGERKAALLNNRSVRFESEFNFEVDKWRKLYQTTCSGIKILDWAITPLIVDGLLIGYVEQIQDITVRKQAEKRLLESEERFNLAITGTGAGLWDWDMVNNTLYLAPQWKAMLGYEDHEIENNFTGWKKLWHPDDVTKIEESIKDYLEEKIAKHEIEHRLRHKNGDWRWILARGDIIKDSDGKPSRWVGTHIDITKLKELEEELTSSERRLSAFSNVIGEAIFFSDKGICIETNESAIKMFGYSYDEIIGKFGTYFIAPENKELVKNNMLSGYAKPYDVLAIKKDGSKFWCELSGRNFNYKDKDIRVTSLIDISVRKQHEKELNIANEKIEESEERFEIVIQAAQTGVWDWNIETNESYFSPRWCEILGYSFDDKELEHTHKSWVNRIHKEDYDRVMHEFDLHLKEDKPYNVDYRHLHKSGEYRWQNSKGKAIRNETGKAVRVVGRISDITKQKTAELALKESETRFKALHNASFGGISIHDKGIILDCNKGLSDMTGYSVEELIGMDGLLLIAEQSRDSVMKNISSAYEKPYEAVGLRKNGTEFPLRLEGRNIPYKGKMARTVEFRDITERKQYELEIIQANEKIEESEEKHRTVADYAYNWEYWTDTNGNFVYISPSCERIAGYKPDDFTNNKELLQGIIHPDDVNIFQNHNHDIDENGERSQIEFRIITKQKKIRWIGHVCNNIIATNGKSLGIRGSNRDITERKKAEQALMKRDTELREANTTKDKLFSIIAHDLRSPFSSILGFSELLLEDREDYDVATYKMYSKQINSSAKNTLVLLDNLLNWAKSQTGQINFKPEKAVLASIIQEIFELSNLSAKNKNIVLNHIPSEEIIVFADPNMIKTVLRNLISNAIKFTNSNGKIDVYALQNDKFIEIAVSDNGVGMNEETRNKLFSIETNETTLGTANEKGSGLGLLLCKEFVEKHGGKIWIESEEGKGSIFYFTLPYQTETIIEKSAENEILLPVEDTSINKLKILIIEDDETSEMLLSIAVQKLGSEIISVKTGTEAVVACLNNPDIDVVLMDIQMPGMNGYEATSKIREFNKDVIIIAQTAFALEGDREKAIASGCNDYLAKPIKKNELLKKIEKLLS